MVVVLLLVLLLRARRRGARAGWERCRFAACGGWFGALCGECAARAAATNSLGAEERNRQTEFERFEQHHRTPKGSRARKPPSPPQA